MKAWHIPQWNDLFESNKSREIGTLTYYLQPNKTDGEGFGFLRQQADWLEIYGVFGLLKIQASKSERRRRGWLFRNGTPLTVDRLAALTGAAVEKIQRCLKFLSSAPMDWILFDECPGTASAPAGQEDDTTHTGHGHGTASAPAGQESGGISPRLMTDKMKTDVGREREEMGGFASKDQSRAAQITQFASASARKRELEAIEEDERTEQEAVELKKMRGLLRAIQKKQAAGDFTPVQTSKL